MPIALLRPPIRRANFPLVTVALISINVSVYLLLQSGDSAAENAASEYYQSSGLSVMEAPLYQRHLAQFPDPALVSALQQVPVSVAPMVLDQWQQHDLRFRGRLARGELFQSEEQKARWSRLQTRFERLLSRVFTDRHALRADGPSLANLFSSIFLHGGADHLIGNTLFLLALGLLVESALGPTLFTALYLLGGVGAGVGWAALNQHGSLVGASGAIACLVGVLCVLCARRCLVDKRRHRLALAALALWFGWELARSVAGYGGSVAYEAHAGGLAVGTLLSLLVTRRRGRS